MRLLGRTYVSYPQPRPGWIEGPVVIGAYSFIGPHSLIEAGTRLGRGTLVRAGSVVRGEFPDFAVLQGNPAQVVGDTRHTDEALLARYPEARAHYEAWAGRSEAGVPTPTPQPTPPSA
jgi:acetyltransferase-like isoleucine patch superfamily enzyme